MPRILLIAEESDLRRSVQFALDAEGYAVTARAGLTPPEPARHFDCTIIDHPTADADPTALAFFAAHAPIVLLADALTHPLAPHATRTVLKPLLGPALSAAIREAIGKVRRA